MRKYLFLLIFLFLFVDISYAEDISFAYLLLDPPADVNHYRGEFARLNARSAEFKVISECWGSIYNVKPGSEGEANKTLPEKCKQPTENIIPSPDTSMGKVTLETKKKTYTFNLSPYYAQDTVMTLDEALALLTDYNLDKFKEIFEDEVIDKLTKDVTDKDGKTITVPDEAARKEAWNALERVVQAIREQYGNIDVIAEGYKAKQVYMHKTYLSDIENTVFAQNPDGDIIGIKTDKYNDIFQQHIAKGIETDIIRSLENGLRQYRLVGDANGNGIGNFYLCENCSKCEKCTKLVASGEDWESEILLYFSRHCVNHACRFVWEEEVDSTNPGGTTKEGLKCSEERIGAKFYCKAHTCRNSACGKAIVGVSIVDASSFVDKRATGEKAEEGYSNYCAEHKCMTFSCRKAKVGQNTKAIVGSDGNMISFVHCGEHRNQCNIWVGGGICGNPVSENAHTKSGNAEYPDGRRMICEGHLDILTTLKLNNPPPKFEKCAYCGEYTYLCLGGKACGNCFNEIVFKANREMSDLISSMIKDYENESKIRVEEKLKKLLNAYRLSDYFIEVNGEWMPVNIGTWRSDQGFFKDNNNNIFYGFDYNSSKNTATLTPNCIISYLMPFAKALMETGASVYIDEGKLLDGNIYRIMKDENIYEICQLNNKEVCTFLNNLNGTESTKTTSNYFENLMAKANADYELIRITIPDNLRTPEIMREVRASTYLNALETATAYNTKDKSDHTNVNTGEQVTVKLKEGSSIKGMVFYSYGSGNDSSPTLPTYYTLYREGPVVKRVIIKKEEDGSYVEDPDIKVSSSKYLDFSKSANDLTSCSLVTTAIAATANSMDFESNEGMTTKEAIEFYYSMFSDEMTEEEREQLRELM